MSVIIKGMDMPKNEELWIRVQPDGNIVSQTGYVIEDASAKQVPPHGRLIDADALVAELERLYHGSDREILAINTVLDAPTIIEAEVKE